jgi:hypothetical protein
MAWVYLLEHLDMCGICTYELIQSTITFTFHFYLGILNLKLMSSYDFVFE